ncbi:MAG TPA: hypothetical protein PK303_05500 [bacterium]|nr:hypothetical protein [bacterium]HOL35143.1 hypothetical protein [bacterium]HPP08554.1 hypothetical protein [bacterium]
MDFIDYGHSYIQTSGPQNAVRFLIESQMELIDLKTGQTKEFFQVASCKSENTFARENLFKKDNYNFLPVFLDRENIIIFRSFVPLIEEQYVSVDDKTSQTWKVWGHPSFILKKVHVELLKNAKEVIMATHNGCFLIGRSQIVNENAGFEAIIEYPIKTMNTCVETNMYQVDTGPVIYPDFEKNPICLHEFVKIAYIAFNKDDFAEFIIEQPTQIKDSIVIPHFSEIRCLSCKNFLYSIKDKP